jgi:predicted HTH domain antitoxin
MKTAIELQFNLPLNTISEIHLQEALQKAHQAFVLELLKQGNITPQEAAQLLNIELWQMVDLMINQNIPLFNQSGASHGEGMISAKNVLN